MNLQTPIVSILLGLGVLTACGSDLAEDTTTSSSIPATSTSESLLPSTTVGFATTTEAELLEMASVTERGVSDLASRLNISPDSIEVVSFEDVQWPDASVGCPEEGMMYAQVVTPGYQVILQAGGRFYDYHAATDGDIFLCPSDENDGGYDSVPPSRLDE